MTTMPRYPVFIPSKKRSDACLTARALRLDGVPFKVVVAPQEVESYAREFGSDSIAELPTGNMDIVAVRNWIRDQSVEAGDERHWQLDDNIRMFRRWFKGKRMPCSAGVALRVCEDFTDRYENVAVSGLNYTMFAHSHGKQPLDPFWLNVHVYSCSLLLNSMPFRWRGPYNDDTDLCLQVLAGGWCTILLNAFMCDKVRTMTMKGGMTDANLNSYQGDGRLRMARSLERKWPGVVTTDRRWQRPQHVVKDQWRKFDTPLRLKPGVDVGQTAGTNEYGMRLAQLAPVKSARLQKMLDGTRDDVSTGHAALTPVPKSSSVLDESPVKALPGFLDLIRAVPGVDVDAVRVATEEALRSEGQRGALRDLEDRWYTALSEGRVDWSVYDDPIYFAGLWMCWVDMSRQYLLRIRDSALPTGGSVVQDVGQARLVADLGCGVAYTTAALVQLFPDARVVGTNLEDTRQMPVCREMAARHRFEVSADMPAGPVDLVFASEYFEHFQAPVRHLREVLDMTRPKAMVVASTFTQRSVGHFDSYDVDGLTVSGHEASRRFNDALRKAGYVSVQTGFWNKRPAYWRITGG